MDIQNLKNKRVLCAMSGGIDSTVSAMLLKEAGAEVIGIKYYAWGYQKESTWFITKTKKSFLPKGCRLLFELNAVVTNEQESTKETYPQINDVVITTTGEKIKIVDIKWC